MPFLKGNQLAKGHIAWNKGIHLSNEIRRKMSESTMGSKNPRWAGDKVGYSGVHKWAKQYLVKPSICPNCRKSGSIDLANISQEYKRDLSDWEWLCQKCHMTKDGRLNNFILYRRTKYFSL